MDQMQSEFGKVRAERDEAVREHAVLRGTCEAMKVKTVVSRIVRERFVYDIRKTRGSFAISLVVEVQNKIPE